MIVSKLLYLHPTKFISIQSNIHFFCTDGSVDCTCGKIFRNKSNFKVHERKHTGEKPFKCKFCPKSFSSSGNRKEHHRRHTQNKVYKCEHPGCREAFHRHQ